MATHERGEGVCVRPRPSRQAIHCNVGRAHMRLPTGGVFEALFGGLVVKCAIFRQQ